MANADELDVSGLGDKASGVAGPGEALAADAARQQFALASGLDLPPTDKQALARAANWH